MKRYLITGCSGFVGKYYIKYLLEHYLDVDILGVDIEKPELSHINFKKINMLNFDELHQIIKTFKPEYILHLASFSSVAFSWKYPIESFSNNTNIFLNLLESIRLSNIQTTLISVGSSEEYGNIQNINGPLNENSELNPLSPYAVARVSQEMLSKVYYNGFGMNIIMTRSFNHIGPFQKEIFVIPSFVKQFADAKKNKTNEIELITGNISVSRDFLDVRDVVKAYDLLFQKGEAGQTYNICSGKDIKIKQIIHELSEMTGIKPHIKISNELLRPTDLIKIVGSNKKIKNKTGWSPQITLRESLNDMLSAFM